MQVINASNLKNQYRKIKSKFPLIIRRISASDFSSITPPTTSSIEIKSKITFLYIRKEN